MAAVAFDTYKMIKRLRDAGFTDTQAEAVSGAVQEGSTVDLSILATKTDLEAVRHNLEMKISETKSEISETKGELKADLAETRAEMKADNLRLEGKVEAARAEMKADNLRLETKIEAAKNDTLKAVMALIFSAVVVNALVIFGAVFGLAKMLGH